MNLKALIGFYATVFPVNKNFAFWKFATEVVMKRPKTSVIGFSSMSQFHQRMLSMSRILDD
jgi:hypothetical protein